MDRDAYDTLPHLNFSAGKWLLTSGQHFQAMRSVEREETIAMRMGMAIDEFVSFGIVRPFAVMPEEIASLTGTGSRTAKSAWKAEQKAKGCTVYTADEAKRQRAMIDSLTGSHDFQALLKVMPQRQHAVTATYRGVPMKCMLDLAGHDDNGRRIICDLKTAMDGSPRGFGKAAFTRDYDLQICLYGTILSLAEGLEDPPIPCWAVVESSHAAPVSLFSVPQKALESGQRKLDKMIDRYLEYTASGVWPGYGAGWQTPIWPRWASDE